MIQHSSKADRFTVNACLSSSLSHTHTRTGPGHAQVPIGYKKNVKLANWVSTQRQEAKLGSKGRSSRLNQERIDLLNSVGFVWEAQRGGGRKILRAVKEKVAPVGRKAPPPHFPADADNYDSSDEEAASSESQSRKREAGTSRDRTATVFGGGVASASARGRDVLPQRSPAIEQLLLSRPSLSTRSHRSGSNATASSLVTADMMPSSAASRATTSTDDLGAAAVSSPHTNLPFVGASSAGAVLSLGSDLLASHRVQQPTLPSLDEPLTPEEQRLYHYLLKLEHERGVRAAEGTLRRRHRLRQLLALGHIDTILNSSPYLSLGGGSPILSSSSNFGLVAAHPSTLGYAASSATSAYCPTTTLSPRSSAVLRSTTDSLPFSDSTSLIRASSLAQQRLLLLSPQQEQELLHSR